MRRALLVLLGVSLLGAAPAPAQGLGNLVSPGKLAHAHAKLEGFDNCQKCHTPGKQVLAAKCLACHEPVAKRIAAKKGVHREVKDDCVACHVEHAGVDAELRPIDTKGFDHKTQAGFPLEGKHAVDCARCHTTRSFLAVKPDCVSCHKDVHAGKLGLDCASCHSATVPFKETKQRFDHGKTAYPLTGAHQKVACETCHKTKEYRGLAYATCASCHKDPHAKPLGTCASCHTTESFKATAQASFEHGKTGYALAGKHAQVPCVKCHVQPPAKVRLKSDRCATCHTDVHKGVFKEDCASCHKETGFPGAPFDHAKKARFLLDGRHAELRCAACHKGAAPAASVPLARRTVDFRGAAPSCVTCHKDVHKGQLGTSCQTCHTSRSFKLTVFRHPRFPEFFAGAHQAVACEKCHGREPSGARAYKGVPLTCATCHKDVHQGQLGTSCETCHAVTAAKFAAPGFSHAKARFALDGKHRDVACQKCHRSETGTFPAGSATAVRYKPLALECRACHQDPHLGQLGARCETCHTSASFKQPTRYVHLREKKSGFFVAAHAKADCQACHKKETGAFPSGKGTAVRYTADPAACASCHTDPHKGTLGPDCASCHTPAQWGGASRAFHKAGAFPLDGRHLLVPCASCHLKGVVKGTPTSCYDCHWVRHQDDKFRTALGPDCESCHRTTSWTSVSWEHGARTGFPLGAPHQKVDCAKCHAGGVFTKRPADCYSCHRSDYEKAKDPDHVAAGFPIACQTCHLPSHTTFRQAKFDHQGTYPLVGAHAVQACGSCHKGSVYKGTPRDCAGCHKPDFDRATAPNHAAAGFALACETCHRNSDPTWKQGKYSHTAAWPLVGAHATPSCVTCHKATVYKGLPSDCVACHKSDYDQSKEPGHLAAGFPTACESCHKVADPTWKQGKFDHAPAYPLVGAHAVQTCVSCHKGGVYKGTSRDCVGCHKPDFDRSAAPNHVAAGFALACETCHRGSDPTWKQGKYTHTAAWPLVGAHTTPACATCHRSNVYKGLPSDCVACHKTDYDQSKEPPHQSAGFPTACATCHKVSDPTWKQGKFDHAPVYPLAGAHAVQTCTACHKAGVYKGTSRDCVGCHKADFDRSAAPNHVAAGFATACETCHKNSDPTWKQGKYTHTSAWPLLGAHVTPTCVTCHRTNVYKGLPSDCVSCHKPDYDQSKEPPHQSAGFPTACESCHKVSDPTWKQGKFDHATTYALVGAHAVQTCTTCHKNGVYKGTPRDCVGCHKADADGSVNPNHTAAGFATTCDSCHKNSDPAWNLARYPHTTWPLQGAHVTPTCVTCHKTTVYKGLPSDCVSCHKPDYDQSKEPPHLSAGFPTACESCHKVSDPTWKQGKFDHATTYALVGAHAVQACTACHKNGIYKGTPRDCVGCHKPVYDASVNPNHAAAGFSTACETCHKNSDPTWQLARYTHTRWPLQGAHVTPTCVTCHKTGVYAGLPTDCVTCHRTDYDQSRNPNHVTAGFPTTCVTCHKVSDATWKQGTFDHASRYPLVGAHALQTCAACHVNGVYTGTPRDCVGCHQAKYNQAVNPNHVAAGFSTACETCHKNSDPTWKQGTYAHTRWPLLGKHPTVTCVTCHKNNVYAGLPSTCVSCHLPDYQGAREPNHVTAGFPTTCDTCHKLTDTSWDQGTFNHNATFPLVGAHAVQACSACHVNGVYQGTPRTCVGCHLPKYNQAVNPNHVAAGFSTACETCHKNSDPTWHQGTYAHTSWPLVGKHPTVTCVTCHKNNVYAGLPSTCVSCHLADYQGARNPNHVTAGFPTTCDTCHQVSHTSWSQGTFNHNASFPLVGAHAVQACGACHVNGVYQGTPRTCVGCHLPKYNQAVNPNHIAAGFSTACETCHKNSDPTWQLGTYAHSAWQLLGNHKNPRCVVCHTNNVYAGLPSTCVSCHLAKYQQTQNPNHIAAGFPTTCETCHKATDTSWDQGVFNHTWFPIASGRHSGNPCSACHTNPSNYQVFTCLTCHGRTETDREHRGRQGYVYDSQACYACHPQGRAD